MRPYRPLDAPSTPLSNSPSSQSLHQALQGPPDLDGSSFQGTSPDNTSSPSEPSRSSPRTLARSPPPPRDVQRSGIQPPVSVNDETRPGPEDAEGSTRRWSFRSRKANQLQPYRFDRLQYKQQLRWNPDAVVTALSPPRRRSSPRSATDQEFIIDHDEDDTQETGEREEETQPPALSPPQWFLDGMKEISDAESDDDVVGYLAGCSHKKLPTAEFRDNAKVSGVSCKCQSKSCEA